MRICLRTDASFQIGTGHVIRCLTLADELHKQGIECLFICREHEGHMFEYIKSRGYSVHALPRPGPRIQFDSDLVHARWLQVDWEIDAAQTLHAIENKAIDYLIVDHYALDHRWEVVLRPVCKHIMVIDDLADREHDCDLLLDQNFGSSAERYRELVPPHCRQFHGPKYAMLKPVYAEWHEKIPKRDGCIRRVLIYFGGGVDAVDLTGMTLQAFRSKELEKVELDIVVGVDYAHQELLKNVVAQRGGATIHRQLPNLADLMAKADLAIGGGGATTWERCCMGLPTITIGIAENQRPACEALYEHGFIEYLGGFSGITVEVILNQVLAMKNNPKAMLELTANSLSLVDGNGVKRVVQVMDFNNK